MSQDEATGATGGPPAKRRGGPLTVVGKALVYGISGPARTLNKAVPLLPAHGQRWRPMPGGGLEQLDQRGVPTGWAFAPVERLKPAPSSAEEDEPED